jgi:hypothetical protein
MRFFSDDAKSSFLPGGPNNSLFERSAAGINPTVATARLSADWRRLGGKIVLFDIRDAVKSLTVLA